MTEQETNTNKVFNSNKTGYVEFNANSKTGLADNFLVALNLDNGKKITLDYNQGNFFRNENFNGKLVKIEPEGTELSKEEKIEALKELGNLIAEVFVPSCLCYELLDRTARGRPKELRTELGHATKLLESAANEFLEEKEVRNILTNNYFESVDKNIAEYSKNNSLDIRDAIARSYGFEIIIGMSKSIFDAFNDNPEEFVINLLNKDGEGNTVFTEKILDCIKNKDKANSIINFISNEEFLKKLSPKQCGKLAFIVSRKIGDKKKLKEVYKQIGIHINSYNESQMCDFSESFAEAVNDSLIRQYDENMRVVDYQGSTYLILQNINNNAYMDIFVKNVYNNMPNFIDGEGNLSKLDFPKSLEKDINLYYKENGIENKFEIDQKIKYTPEEVLADRLCNGRKNEENTIPDYLKAIEELGHSAIDIAKSAINNINEREDIDSYKKKDYVDILCKGFESYEKQKGRKEGFFKKLEYKKKIKTLKKYANDILQLEPCYMLSTD